MIGLQLPRLFGTRVAVSELLTGAQIATDLSDTDVALDASELAAGTSSAADELVRNLLVTRGGKSLTLIGGPPAFGDFLERASRRYKVADRYQAQTGYDLPDVNYV